jgi:hypothetical protein
MFGESKFDETQKLSEFGHTNHGRASYPNSSSFTVPPSKAATDSRERVASEINLKKLQSRGALQEP